MSERDYTGFEIPVVQEYQTDDLDERKPASAPVAAGITGDASDGMISPPAEIPLDADGSVANEVKNSINEDDEEEEFEYDYDDDDEGHFSGFIAAAPSHAITSSSHASADVVPQDGVAKSEHIIEQEITDFEEKSARVDEFSCSKCFSDSKHNVAVMQYTVDSPQPNKQLKSKWREPSQQAVSMSLRVEREKSGGRRRLAADLYKIMMNDTEEAGFSIEPCSEDSMNKWAIKLFKFDEDSHLHKDLMVLGLDHVQLEMNFPEQYPFEPPFVRVVRPRFKRQTGFVMNGALCMELLTSGGWNPVNDIESVIVSIRSLLVVGGGRLEAAVDMPEEKRQTLLNKAHLEMDEEGKQIKDGSTAKRKRDHSEDDGNDEKTRKKVSVTSAERNDVGSYSVSEAKDAYSYLSNYHEKRGWSGWWSKKG